MFVPVLCGGKYSVQVQNVFTRRDVHNVHSCGGKHSDQMQNVFTMLVLVEKIHSADAECVHMFTMLVLVERKCSVQVQNVFTRSQS